MTATLREETKEAPARGPSDADEIVIAGQVAGGSPVDESPSVDAAGPPATWVDRMEAFFSRLSTRDNFWHRIFSLLFLPLAFWSGIRMKKNGDRVVEDHSSSFTAVLPFKKFNKNWYNAMAGASLLANTEIAAGMYVFGEAGGDYTVVCKNLNYTFLRPCHGPAIYRMIPAQPIKPLVDAGTEFNIALEVDVRQLGVTPAEREKRVGRAEITFHVTPKQQAKQRKQKMKVRDKQKAALKRHAS